MFTTRPNVRGRLRRLSGQLEERVQALRELTRGFAFIRPGTFADPDREHDRPFLDEHMLDLIRPSHPYLHVCMVSDGRGQATGADEDWHGGLISTMTLEDIRARNAALDRERPARLREAKRLLAGGLPAGEAAGGLTPHERARKMADGLFALYPGKYGAGYNAKVSPDEALLSADAWSAGCRRLFDLIAGDGDLLNPRAGGVLPSELFELDGVRRRLTAGDREAGDREAGDREAPPAKPARSRPPEPEDIHRFALEALYAASDETRAAVLADEAEAWGLVRAVFGDAEMRYRALDLVAAYPPEVPFEFFYVHPGLLRWILAQIRERPERFEGVRRLLMRDPLLPSFHKSLLYEFEDVIPIREHLLVFCSPTVRDEETF